VDDEPYESELVELGDMIADDVSEMKLKVKYWDADDE
jgi:hypothetical protein